MDTLQVIWDEPSPLLVPLDKDMRHFAWKNPETGRMTPVVQGGADTAIAHPLGPPVITDTSISIDLMLQQPTRITGYLMDITLQRFFADLLFASPGGVTGGAVIYDVVSENEIYLDRDVQRVAPGSEFPIVTSSRRAPQVAEVEKWGGKYYFTDEARDRNEQVLFRNRNVQLGNTIVRKNNQRAVATLEAAIAALGGAGVIVGNDWSAAIPNGSNPSAPSATPHANFATAQLVMDQRELGISLDTLAVSPVNAVELRLFYGDRLSGVLADSGITMMYVTNRIAAGTAYLFARNEVGEQRVEAPLATETWRDPEGKQQTWVQSSVRNVMFVNNPYAVIKLTGL